MPIGRALNQNPVTSKFCNSPYVLFWLVLTKFGWIYSTFYPDIDQNPSDSFVNFWISGYIHHRQNFAVTMKRNVMLIWKLHSRMTLQELWCYQKNLVVASWRKNDVSNLFDFSDYFRFRTKEGFDYGSILRPIKRSPFSHKKRKQKWNIINIIYYFKLMD